MKIGDKVIIVNTKNKSTIQTEIFRHLDIKESIFVETLWRSCKFELTLTSQWEIETLQDTIEGQYELETEDYVDCKLLYTSDGQNVEFSDSRFTSYRELELGGYECIREYYIIHNGVKITTG